MYFVCVCVLYADLCRPGGQALGQQHLGRLFAAGAARRGYIRQRTWWKGVWKYVRASQSGSSFTQSRGLNCVCHSQRL